MQMRRIARFKLRDYVKFVIAFESANRRARPLQKEVPEERQLGSHTTRRGSHETVSDEEVFERHLEKTPDATAMHTGAQRERPTACELRMAIAGVARAQRRREPSWPLRPPGNYNAYRLHQCRHGNRTRRLSLRCVHRRHHRICPSVVSAFPLESGEMCGGMSAGNELPSRYPSHVEERPHVCALFVYVCVICKFRSSRQSSTIRRICNSFWNTNTGI